ncbi:MAG TPA: hypothetical protein PLD41_13005 [Casimicrobium huifangae]|nr:hypothetical protein [Casimicrobium huifangae]
MSYILAKVDFCQNHVGGLVHDSSPEKDNDVTHCFGANINMHQNKSQTNHLIVGSHCFGAAWGLSVARYDASLFIEGGASMRPGAAAAPSRATG